MTFLGGGLDFFLSWSFVPPVIVALLVALSKVANQLST
jgi:hypothetical protein